MMFGELCRRELMADRFFALSIAGGRGVRLRPLTDNRPKPMVEVAGKPILSYQVDWMRSQGVTDVVFLCGYKGEMIREYFGDGSGHGIAAHYSFEESPLGRGGAMKFHRPAVKTLTSLFFKVAKLTRSASWLEICVDTDELRDEYSTITSFPISVLPIPIEQETIEKFYSPGNEDRLTISMLGDARLGKGIDLIPALVEELSAVYPNQLKFIIQTSTPVVGADSDLLGTTLAWLNKIKQEHDVLVLLPKPLTTEEYFSTIAQSDIMLHPYRAESYRYQSSGCSPRQWHSGRQWLCRPIHGCRANLKRPVGAEQFSNLEKLPVSVGQPVPSSTAGKCTDNKLKRLRRTGKKHTTRMK